MAFIERIPGEIKVLFLRLGLAMLPLTLTRIIFYLFNLSSFKSVSPLDFLAGSWFDAITIALVFYQHKKCPLTCLELWKKTVEVGTGQFTHLLRCHTS